MSFNNSIVNGSYGATEMPNYDRNLSLFKAPKLKATKPPNPKVEALSDILRGNVMKKDEQISAPQSTQTATPAQHKLQSKLGILTEDNQLGQAANALGNYSHVTAQQNNASLESARAMNVQTLNSQDDISRIVGANSAYSLLANQFSLNQVENRAFKKYKKSNYNKMASQFF